MKETKVISGFPGIGKTYLFDRQKDDVIVLDSDSSKFSWIEEGVRNPDFPNNYIEHIKDNIGKADYIFVSSHDVVRDALKENEVEYILVSPMKNLKKEYIERFKERGNPDSFIDFISKNWNSFIDEIDNETHPKKIKLGPGEFLADVF